MTFGSRKRLLIQDVGCSEEEHKDAETLKLKLIWRMTMMIMMMMLARVKEMKNKKNQPSKMLENQPNILSLMR
jgi:hypothetical protein